MNELTTELIRSSTPQDLAALLPATVWINETPAVLLRPLADIELIELYVDGRITALSPDVLNVRPLTEPDRSCELLCQAAALLATWRQSVVDQSGELTTGHAAKLTGIRNHAVGLHQDGDICRLGLDRFLAQFDLRPYCNRARVSYTICGRYDVDQTNDYDASIEARRFLHPDLGGIGHIEDQSTRFELAFTVTDLG